MNRNAPSDRLNLLPLGIPTLVIADDPQLIAAAGAAYACWLVNAPLSNPRIELRLAMGNVSPSADVCLDIRVEGSRLTLNRSGAEGVADAVALTASATVSATLAKDPAAFAEVVDTLLLFLLARDGRTPVHASAFMLGSLAVVLAGPSGSGKSTLALEASSRGLPVLSDDMLFVQREPGFALWGFPRPIHVFPADAPPGDHPARLRNGKLKTAVPLRNPALKAERAALVLLARGTGLSIRPIEAGDAIEPLMRLDSGFDLLEPESRAALELLASGGAWLLTLADDVRGAIDLVASHFQAQSRILSGQPVDLG